MRDDFFGVLKNNKLVIIDPRGKTIDKLTFSGSLQETIDLITKKYGLNKK